MFIFTQGKPVDFFVLILEGRVEVTVGRESLIFEGGPFTHFGLQALAQNVGFDSPSQQFNQTQAIKGSLQSLNMDAMLVNLIEYSNIQISNEKCLLFTASYIHS